MKILARDFDRPGKIRELILAIIVEAVETLNEINWKPWKKQQKIVDEVHLKEEVVDVFHFVIELAIVVGMDHKELFYQYKQKMQENIRRQKCK